MNKAILFIIGLALMAVMLTSCGVDISGFCNNKGYTDWKYIAPMSRDTSFFCYKVVDNTIVVSPIYNTVQKECQVYYNDDGCAE